MKLLDVNVLVAAARPDHEHHPLARPWLDQLLGSSESFAIPTHSAIGLVRVATDGRITPSPSLVADAVGFLDDLRQQPGYVLVEPGPRHWTIVDGLCREFEISGRRVPDAHLAALAVEHGATVVSFDRDFARFTTVPWERPAA